jgi:hypothetical protein
MNSLMPYSTLPIKAILSIFLIGTFVDCSSPHELKKTTVCDDLEIEMLDSIQAGNISYLRDYLSNGGDPLFECYENTRAVPGTYRLLDRVASSNSFEIVELYLDQNLSKEAKDDLLTHFINEDSSIVQVLIDNGARISFSVNNCLPIDTLRHNSLEKYGYNYDFVDSNTGMTEFLDYSMCPCPKGADKIIETLKYLIRKGANPNRTDVKGRSAYDLATNQEIKIFLKSIGIN